jgi:predicted transcriptional regulator
MPINTRKQAHSFSLTKEAAKMLREIASDFGDSKSSVVEDAIRRFYNETYTQEPPKSITHLTGKS